MFEYVQTKFLAFDEFRAASDGVNQRLVALKTEISNYIDQSGTDPFTNELTDLQKAIKNLQSTILTTKKEVSLQAILNINQRYLKLVAEWETYKKTRTSE